MITTMILITTAIISFLGIFFFARRLTSHLIDEKVKPEAEKPVSIKTTYPDGKVEVNSIHKVQKSEQDNSQEDFNPYIHENMK